MEVKYINPFLESFTKTLEQLGVSEVKKEGVKKKNKFFVDSDISSVIYLSGSFQGFMALSMNQATAKKLASTMMVGMNTNSIDDIMKSAIGELSSMIAGRASTMLIYHGISLQISPPMVLLQPCDINTIETLAVDFETPSGKIEFDIGFS